MSAKRLVALVLSCRAPLAFSLSAIAQNNAQNEDVAVVVSENNRASTVTFV